MCQVAAAGVIFHDRDTVTLHESVAGLLLECVCEIASKLKWHTFLLTSQCCNRP